MAASTADAFGSTQLKERLKENLLRLLGLVAVVTALALALALFGYDWRDPSLNQATAQPVRNPVGIAGAVAADLLYQLFGLAAWLLVVAGLSWGVRLVLGRRLGWPWLPVLSLPLALMSLAGFLATLPLPAVSSWPLRVGFGGAVGDLEWRWLEPMIGSTAFAWASLALALLCGATALGVRWAEGIWAASRVGAVSLWVGRRLGDAAGAATLRSGRLVREGWRGFDLGRLRRPTALRPAVDEIEDDASEPVSLRRRLRREPAMAGPVGRGLAGRPFGGDREAGPDEMANEAASSVPERRRPQVAPLGDGDEPLPTIRARRPRSSASEAEDEPTERPAAPRMEPVVERTRAATVEPSLQRAFGPAAEAKAGIARPAAPPPAPEHEGAHDFELPGLDLLASVANAAQPNHSPQALMETSRQLETVLDDFGVRGEIIDAKPGPVVTLFELEPAPGTRAARVISLADDIARSLCALSVRVAVVPGRNVIGIELPNDKRQTVYLRELLEAEAYRGSGARLPLALGKDIAGNPIVADLARMPHLLIAGTTGSGKSVAINAMILSLLYRLRPDELRLIMIDPKVIELSVYEDIPHLLAPVVTDPPKAVVALKWVVRQMDERYRLMSHLGVRDIFAFNKRILQAKARGEELKRRVRTGFEPGTGVPIFEEQPIEMKPLPLIVVIVDEVADLMLTAGKEIENAIQRLSQKARAAGVHLIVATQRPSVDVLTGVIKANLPSRISFRVSSKIDSRTILGEPGAEQLLGQGDMLYLMPGDRISRIHGALVTDAEVEQVVRHLKTQGEPDYHAEVTEDPESGGESAGGADGALFDGSSAGGDALYNQAVQIVARDGKASTSYLQRKLSIGYNSAAKLIERMENEGLISRADHVGRRQVLMGRGGVDGTEPTDDPF
ncbi:DNA translocase FtsK 4TM domain-containing protein [Benzoatithermus flavus]|uniref:DNA translocase FtsK n=1 Tax=Benzoatithermus flavus TaxID=3108223 RepID=A0ABU8XQH9_9PROT